MKIRHPRLPIVREVDDPRPWLAQGWVRVTTPAPPKQKTRRSPRR